LIRNKFLFVLSLIIKFTIIWLINAMFFLAGRFYFFLIKLISICRFRLKFSCIGTILISTRILLLNYYLIWNILLIILSFVIELTWIWLIGIMLFGKALLYFFMFEFLIVSRFSIKLCCVRMILITTWWCILYNNFVWRILNLIFSFIIKFSWIRLISIFFCIMRWLHIKGFVILSISRFQ